MEPELSASDPLVPQAQHLDPCARQTPRRIKHRTNERSRTYQCATILTCSAQPRPLSPKVQLKPGLRVTPRDPCPTQSQAPMSALTPPFTISVRTLSLCPHCGPLRGPGAQSSFFFFLTPHRGQDTVPLRSQEGGLGALMGGLGVCLEALCGEAAAGCGGSSRSPPRTKRPSRQPPLASGPRPLQAGRPCGLCTCGFGTRGARRASGLIRTVGEL